MKSRSRSKIQTKEECIVCGGIDGLQRHHVFFGNPNRAHAEEDGMWVWACYYHHTASLVSFHMNRGMDLKLKKYAQGIYEQEHTREDFIQRYGRSYLE
jgi:hypothetical protein